MRVERLLLVILACGAGCSREESPRPAPAPTPTAPEASRPAPLRPLAERVADEIQANPLLAPAGLRVRMARATNGYVTLQVVQFPAALADALRTRTSGAIARLASEGDGAAEALVKLEEALGKLPGLKAVCWQTPPAAALARAHLAVATQMAARGETQRAAERIVRAEQAAPGLPAEATREVRSRINRTRIETKLRAIGLALANYHETHRALPPGVVAGRNRMPYGSWLTLILPFIDAGDVYSAYNFDAPYDGVANSTAARRVVDAFLAPGDLPKHSPHGYGATHFAGVTVERLGARRDPLGVFGLNSSVRLTNVRDGTSHTLVAGQIAGNLPGWAEGGKTLRSIDQGINRDTYRGFASGLSRGALFLFADGSVRFLSEDIDDAVLRALATRNGGERISEEDIGF